jgi:histidine triad (HIT) family protein
MSKSEGCVFCKIASGEAQALIIRRNELVTAFLDINPVVPGHTLVIPNIHFTCMDDAEERYLSALASMGKEIGGLLKDKLGATGYNLLVANGRSAQQSVFHLHFHVVPRREDDAINLWFHGQRASPDAEALRGIYEALL